MSDERRPRAWRLPAGGTLVEGPAFGLHPTGPDPRSPDGEQEGLVLLPSEETPSAEQVRALASEHRKRNEAKGRQTRH